MIFFEIAKAAVESCDLKVETLIACDAGYMPSV